MMQIEPHSQLHTPWRYGRVSWRGVFRIWRRNLSSYLGVWYENATPQFVEPFLFLVAIGFGVGKLIGHDIQGISYLSFIAPALAVVSCINAVTFDMSYLLYIKLRELRSYDSVVTTPIEPQDIPIGELSWAVTRGVVFGSAFAAIVSLFGYTHSWWGLLLPFALVAVGICFGSMAMLFATIVNRMDKMGYFFSLVITPMMLFGGTFFPVSQLPIAARVAVWLTPTYHAVEAARDLMARGHPVAAMGHAGLLLVVGLGLLLNASRRFCKIVNR
jgi:lipooligosaccharide transport system permease protein